MASARAPVSAEAPAGPAAAVPGFAVGPPPGRSDARMTPAVRRLLREHGLSPEMIVGTGGGGRITREDVIDHVEAARTGRPVGGQVPRPALAGAGRVGRRCRCRQPGRGPPTAPPGGGATGGPAIAFPPGADEVLVPMTQMRKGIAAQMTRALAVPHAYVHMEVDVTSLVRLRESQKRDFQAREGLSLSYVPFVVKACVEALKRHRRSTPTGPRPVSWPSAGSTSGSPWRSTRGSSCRSSATSTSSRSAA